MLKLSFSLQIDFTRHKKVLCTTSNVTARSPQELPSQPHPVPRGSRCRSALWPYNTKCASAASLRRCMVCIDMPLFAPAGGLCSLQFGEKSTETVIETAKSGRRVSLQVCLVILDTAKGLLWVLSWSITFRAILVAGLPTDSSASVAGATYPKSAKVSLWSSSAKWAVSRRLQTLEHQVTRHLLPTETSD